MPRPNSHIAVEDCDPSPILFEQNRFVHIHHQSPALLVHSLNLPGRTDKDCTPSQQSSILKHRQGSGSRLARKICTGKNRLPDTCRVEVVT